MDRDLVSALWKLIEPVLEPEGLELVEVEFKREGAGSVLRLYIDGPNGVTLDDCVLISRQVSALLDVEDPIERSYNLEVSSPGINRVIRKEKDFVRFAGNNVRIKTRRKIGGRRNFSGILKGVENSMVILEVDDKRVELAQEDIEKARLDLPDAELFRKDLNRIDAGFRGLVMEMNLNRVLDQVAKEKGIARDALVEALEAALVSAARKKFGSRVELEAQFTDDSGEIEVFLFKDVVEVVEDPTTQIDLETARTELDPDAEIGDTARHENGHGKLWTHRRSNRQTSHNAKG